MLFLCCLVMMCSGLNNLYLLIFFCDLLLYFFVVYFLHIKKGFHRLMILADEIPFFVILSYFTIPSMNAISLTHLVDSFSNL